MTFDSSAGEQRVKPSFPAKLKFLFQPARYKVMYGGRGASKSWGVARALLILGMKEKTLILCAREYQASIEDSCHKLLADQIALMGLQDFYKVQKNVITGANGTEFIFRGLKINIGSVKSLEGVNIVWIEEAQNVSKKSWETLDPTIRRKGSEVWITFNPELDTDETYKRFVLKPPPSAVVVKMNWSDNPFFDEDGGILRSQMEHARNTDPDAWLNVWEGHCKHTVEGAIYAKELRNALAGGQITKVPYETTKPVNTFWDLGFSDATAIWFCQRVGFEYRIIDFLEVRQTGIPDILLELQKKQYVYDTDYLPHDAQAQTIQANGRTIEQQLKSSGRRVRIVPKQKVADGINAARSIFPSCYFDEEKCADGLQALRHYRYDVDPDTKQFSKNPLHNEYSHAADAFRYLAISVKDGTTGTGPNLKLKRQEALQRTPYRYAGGGGGSAGWMG